MTAVNLLMRWLHIFSVIAAVGATVLGLLQLTTTTAGALRRTARVAATLAVPALVATGLGMLVVGQGLPVGVLERITLATCVLGLCGCAAVLVRRRPAA